MVGVLITIKRGDKVETLQQSDKWQAGAMKRRGDAEAFRARVRVPDAKGENRPDLFDEASAVFRDIVGCWRCILTSMLQIQWKHSHQTVEMQGT